ncbi:hypothetical protein ACF0H5_016927 [Mactra antiquata]
MIKFETQSHFPNSHQMLPLSVRRIQVCCNWKHDICLRRFIHRTRMISFLYTECKINVRSAVHIHIPCTWTARSWFRKFEWTMIQDFNSIKYLSHRLYCTKHGKNDMVNSSTDEITSSTVEYVEKTTERTSSTDSSASEDDLSCSVTNFSSSSTRSSTSVVQLGVNQRIDEHYHKMVNEKLKDLQKLLDCSNEQLDSLINRYPYLGCLEVIENINEIVKVLVSYAYSKTQYNILLSLFNCLICFNACEIKTLLDNHQAKSRKKKTFNISKVIKSNATEKLTKGEQNRMKFISEKLNMDLDVLLSFTDVESQKTLNRFHPCYISCRIDYLLWEGMTRTEIALNLKLLKHSSEQLSKKIIDMKANLGKISINVLLNGISSQPKLKNRRKLNRIYKVLNCSRKDFSGVEKAFMDKKDEAEVFDSLQCLLELGFSKTEIRKNVYILGHRPEFIKHAFETNKDQVDMTVLEGQRLLLNLIVYDLEYGYKYSVREGCD